MPLIPPTKIVLRGNKGQSQQFIKFATTQLSILERQMAFQKLNEGRRVVSPFDGVTVECTNKFGRKEVSIYVAPFIPPEMRNVIPNVTPILEDAEESVSCLCGKFFAEGVVVAIEAVEGYVEPARLYTVDICQADNKQVTVPNCIAQDFSMFEVGQKVWCCLAIREVIPAKPTAFTLESYLMGYAFSAPWGASGTERSFTWVDYNSGSGNYTSFPYVISDAATGPCDTDLTLIDEDWAGVYPSMCNFSHDMSNCYWSYKMNAHSADYSFEYVKNHESLYTRYSMLITLGVTPDPLIDYTVTWLSNVQIIAQ
jgi:hypothetical protein